MDPSWDISIDAPWDWYIFTSWMVDLYGIHVCFRPTRVHAQVELNEKLFLRNVLNVSQPWKITRCSKKSGKRGWNARYWKNSWKWTLTSLMSILRWTGLWERSGIPEIKMTIMMKNQAWKPKWFNLTFSFRSWRSLNTFKRVFTYRFYNLETVVNTCLHFYTAVYRVYANEHTGRYIWYGAYMFHHVPIHSIEMMHMSQGPIE